MKDTKYYKTNVQGTEVKRVVYYSKGSEYTREVRGFYLSVYPVNIEHRGDGITIESASAMSGYKIFLGEAKRYSDKAMNEKLEIAENKENEALNLIEKAHDIGIIK